MRRLLNHLSMEGVSGDPLLVVSAVTIEQARQKRLVG